MNAPEHTLNEDYTGPGEVLQRARVRAGMSPSQVATHLNMLKSQIVALEEENYSRLSGEIFIIGYLRNYAKLLNLNENKLVALYQQQKEQAQQTSAVDVDSSSQDDDISAGSALTMRAQHREHKTVYGLALSIFLVTGLWLYNQQPEPMQPSDSNVVRVDTVDGTTVVGPLTEYSEESFDISLPAVLQTSSIEMAGVQLDNQPSESSTGDLSLASADVHVSQLSFYFTGDCWVEVHDGNDSLIYANLKRAEDKLQLIGKPPFRVILGYAPAVSLSFNGQPVDIESHRHDNMAKLTLGSS